MKNTEMTLTAAHEMVLKEVGDSISSVMSDISPKELFNATNNSTYNLNEFIGHTIMLAGFYIERVRFTKRDTLETIEAPKVILFDADGTSYGCTSLGIYYTLSRMVAAFGPPSTWAEPLPVEVRQVQRGERRTYTLFIK